MELTLGSYAIIMVILIAILRFIMICQFADIRLGTTKFGLYCQIWHYLFSDKRGLFNIIKPGFLWYKIISTDSNDYYRCRDAAIADYVFSKFETHTTKEMLEFYKIKAGIRDCVTGFGILLYKLGRWRDERRNPKPTYVTVVISATHINIRNENGSLKCEMPNDPGRSIHPSVILQGLFGDW